MIKKSVFSLSFFFIFLILFSILSIPFTTFLVLICVHMDSSQYRFSQHLRHLENVKVSVILNVRKSIQELSMLYCVSAIMTSNHVSFPPISDQRITDETPSNIFYCLFLLHDWLLVFISSS